MQQLTASADVFETFFDQAAMGLALADLSTRYVRVNRTYAALLGRAPEDLIGLSFSEVLHPEDRAGDDQRVQHLLDGLDHSLEAEQRFVEPDGRTTWVLHCVTVVPGAEGEPAWFAVSAQDISERRRVEHDLRDLTATLAERAVRDPLTGLANRTLLLERLRSVLARDARSGQTTALLFLDLDGFKNVNDKHGHAVGDLALKVIADRLQALVRPSDTVARLGGDEFLVLVEGATSANTDLLIHRMKSAVEAPIGQQHLTVGVSIGVAISVAGEAEAGALVAAADRAMYRVKNTVKTDGKSTRAGGSVLPRASDEDAKAIPLP